MYRSIALVTYLSDKLIGGIAELSQGGFASAMETICWQNLELFVCASSRRVHFDGKAKQLSLSPQLHTFALSPFISYKPGAHVCSHASAIRHYMQNGLTRLSELIN